MTVAYYVLNPLVIAQGTIEEDDPFQEDEFDESGEHEEPNLNPDQKTL